MSHRTRLVAFYLPQFHPFPENDLWWGKGFTEWTNVTKAEPMFVGHYQPHLPADLGFYDLRLPEVMHEQIKLAKEYGIDAFCYHFYWFSGKRLMERPLDQMLADASMKMPFCLCWANENWTRRWDAAEHEVLIAQKYHENDPVSSIKALEPYLRDSRYLLQDGRKLIIVYQPRDLPNPAKWMETWRSYARDAGLGELYLLCALTHGNWEYRKYGFDGGVEFPPHNIGSKRSKEVADLGFLSRFSGILVDYREVAEFYLSRDKGKEVNVFRTVYPSWDNTARRKERALVTLNGDPSNYEFWLKQAIELTESEFPDQQRLVFINAWNEWAEGCHLEPDRKHGHGFLRATANAKRGSALDGWSKQGVPVECGAEEQLKALHKAQTLVKVKPKHRTIARRAAHVLRDFSRRLRGKKVR